MFYCFAVYKIKYVLLGKVCCNTFVMYVEHTYSLHRIITIYMLYVNIFV